jgi:SPFH domain / Band 7 family
VIKLFAAVLLLVAAVAVLAKGRLPRPGGADGGVREISIRLAAVPLVVVAGAFLLWASVYRLDTGEAAVLKPLSGAVHDSEAAAGFHTKAPWVQAVKFDVRNQVISFFGTTGTAKFEDGQITDTRITGQTSDNSTAYIDATITYSIDPEKVLTVYNDYRTQENLQSRKILPGVRSASPCGPSTSPRTSRRTSTRFRWRRRRATLRSRT